MTNKLANNPKAIAYTSFSKTFGNKKSLPMFEKDYMSFSLIPKK
jgi:hypothetical protein